MVRAGLALLSPLFLLLFLAFAGLPYPRWVEAEARTKAWRAGTRPYHVLGIDRSSVGSLRLTRIRTLMLNAPENAWAVLEDLERWPEFFRLFSEIRPVQTSEDFRRYRFFVRPPWPMADFESVVLVRSIPEEREILWNIEDGGLSGMFGRILVLDASPKQGSEIVYESFGAVGKSLPAWVVKIGLHIVLPGVLEELSERLQALYPSQPDNGP